MLMYLSDRDAKQRWANSVQLEGILQVAKHGNMQWSRGSPSEEGLQEGRTFNSRSE